MLFEGKTLDEAIENGLKELDITKDQAQITIISDVVKGLFGRIKSLASVNIEKKEEEKKAKDNKTAEFVVKILSYLGANVSAKVEENDEHMVITLSGEDTSSVIGYRGEVLDAVQTIAGAKENIGRKVYKKVVVDCENYRDKREETLITLAKRLEKKATELRREVILEPMCPYERRVIHTTLTNSQTVTTKSEGKEPNRYVVIVPNDKDVFSKPYNAGRNNEKLSNNKKGKNQKHDNKNFKKSKPMGSSSQKKTITFGTYLGNSLKNDK